MKLAIEFFFRLLALRCESRHAKRKSTCKIMTDQSLNGKVKSVSDASSSAKEKHISAIGTPSNYAIGRTI